MKIEQRKNGSKLIMALQGRLDTTTAPELEAALKPALDGVTSLILDLAGLEYISSAGLRVLLSAQKVMNRQGEMKVAHANEAIMEIFEVTGFSDILTIAGEADLVELESADLGMVTGAGDPFQDVPRVREAPIDDDLRQDG